MNEWEWFLIAGEVLLLGIIGNYAGKLIHGVALQIIKRITKRTTLTLDDYLIQYVEYPLRVSITILTILLISGVIPNLAIVQSPSK